MTDSAASEAASKALVLKVLAELFEDRDASALDRYYAGSLIQRNPRMPDGTGGLRARVTASTNVHHQAGMVATDGDIVMVHGRYEGLGPRPMVGGRHLPGGGRPHRRALGRARGGGQPDVQRPPDVHRARPGLSSGSALPVRSRGIGVRSACDNERRAAKTSGLRR
jgi:hypothetical protein